MIPSFGALTSPDAMTKRFCPDCGGELLPGGIVHNCDDEEPTGATD